MRWKPRSARLPWMLIMCRVKDAQRCVPRRRRRFDGDAPEAGSDAPRGEPVE